MAIDDYFAAPPPPPPTVPGRFAASAPPPLAGRPPERRSVLTIVLGTLGVVIAGAGIAGYFALQASQAHEESAAVDNGLALAHRVELQSALQGAVEAEEAWSGTHGSYTTDLTAAGSPAPKGVRLTVVQASASGYCLEATAVAPGTAPMFWSSDTGSPSAVPCR